MYLQEQEVVPPLDRWIARVFEPDRLEETCRKLAQAQAPSVKDEARLGAIRETLAECDARLARYRHALEAGADPAVVAGWIRDVQAERRSIEHEFGGMAPAAVWSAEDMQALVESVGDLVAVLRGAEPQKKAELYGELGLTLTYDIVEADLSRVRMVRVGGGI